MGWIRWTYVGPRLAILAVLVGAVHLGLPSLLRWSLVTSGQRLVGAKVEVGDVECAWLGSSIIIRDVRAADPEEPLRNLVAADRVVLEIEPGSLSRKRLVVGRGAIEGLRFGTSRATSGALDPEAEPAESTVLCRLMDSAAAEGQAWLSGYWTNLRTKLEEDIRSEVRSIGLADELSGRWSGIYGEYQRRVQDVLRHAIATEVKIRQARENPLRHLTELRQATGEIDRINQELGKLAEEINALGPQLDRDREAVWAAWQADRQRLQAGFAVDASNGAALSDYLLQEAIAGRVGTLVRWVRRIRSLVPAGPDAPHPQRHRGAAVIFAGMQRHPEYLVRSLEISGLGRHDGEPFELAGTIIGLSSQPALYGRPMIVKVAGRGALQMDVEASFDRTGEFPVDRFLVEFPAIVRSPLELGRPETFSLALPGGKDTIHAELTVDQAALKGMVVVKMFTAGLTVRSDRHEATATMAQSLNTSLAEVERVDATLHLEGSLSEPLIRLESTLGTQLLAAVESAARKEVAERRQELQLALEQELRKKLTETQRQVGDQRRQLEQRLTQQQTALIRMAADTFGLGNRPTIRLGSSEDAGSRPPSAQETTFQR